MTLDILFPALGESVPTDHAYLLYAALSRIVPAFHEAPAGVRFCPLTGQNGGPGLLRLTPRSRLRVRLPDDRIRDLIQLAGKKLDLGDHHVRLGVPSVMALTPAPTLAARTVTIKHNTEPGPFLSTARQRLNEIDIRGEISIPLRTRPGRYPEPARRVVRIKGKKVIGFAVIVEGLTAEESLQLQECGMGGRVRMGCGFFVPVRAK